MDVLKLAGFAVGAALLLLLLRRLKPEVAVVAASAAGCVLLMLAMPGVRQLMAGLLNLAERGGVQEKYLTQLLKVTGISLLMDFAAQTCRDAGEDGLAMKAELAGRVMILTLAVPALETLLHQMMELAP